MAFVRVLPGEVQLLPVEPGRAPMSLTPTEALALANELIAALSLPAPYFPRPSLVERITDWWRRWRTPKPSAAAIAAAQRMMGAGPEKSVTFK